MNNLSIAETCPLRNLCQITETEGPLCGSQPAHLPPLLPAEAVCLDALAGQLEDLEDLEMKDDRGVIKSGNLSTRIAGSMIEMALSPSLDDTEATQLFTEAESRLAEVIKTPGLPISSLVDPDLQLAYVPIYKLRREGRAPSKATLQSLKDSVGLIFDKVLSAPVHSLRAGETCPEEHGPCVSSDNERRRKVQRTTTHLIGTMRDRVIYPSILRNTSRSSTHYDSYLKVEGQDRIVPLAHAKEGRPVRTSGSIIEIAYTSLFDKASAMCEIPYSSDHETKLYEALREQALGNQVEQEKSNVIRTASNIIFSEIWHSTKRTA